MRFDKKMAEILRDLAGSGRFFRICAEFAPATARRNFTDAMLGWASKVSHCIATSTLGRNGRNRRVIRNDLRKKHPVTTARRSIGLMPGRQKRNCRPLRDTNGIERSSETDARNVQILIASHRKKPSSLTGNFKRLVKLLHFGSSGIERSRSHNPVPT